MATVERHVPGWFGIVAALLLLWGLLGCYACLEQLRFGADAMGPANAEDRAMFAALPAWYNPLYAVAVLAGAGGAAALLLRRRVAVPLAAVALAAEIVMFGYMFLATDLIARKGVLVATGFPIVVMLIGAGQLWLASRSRTRGLIG